MIKKGFFVTGTGTGIGKTLVSLGLCLHFKADYWKPVQTGSPPDSDLIKAFLPKNRLFASSYQLKQPLSPNQSAEKQKLTIDLKKITPPKSSFLIVEGIGGVYVPLNDNNSLMDLMSQLKLPLIVVADSRLGTLNHSLLTLEALKNRQFKIAGVILSGPKHPDNKRDIEHWSGQTVVLEVPLLTKNNSRGFKKHI